MSKSYKDHIRSVYKPLSREEQRVLYAKFKCGDDNARSCIICSCLPLVYNLASKFHSNNRHVELDDLIQEGNTALIKAVDNWDVERASITTVATWYIRNALIDMVKDYSYRIKTKYDITKYAWQDIKKIESVGSTDVDVIKEKTGLPIKRIKCLLDVMASNRVNYQSVYRLIKSHGQENELAGPNVKGCVADILALVDTYIESQKDKLIFNTWVQNINKNNKARLVANIVNCSVEEVLNSIKKTKKKLKDIVKNA